MDVAVRMKDDEKGTAAEMIDQIVHGHHAFTRSQLKKIVRLLSEDLREDSEYDLVPESLRECFWILHKDLMSHLDKEEAELFPYVKDLEVAVRSQGVPALPKFVSVKHPIRMFITEHKEAYNIIKKIRSATNNYKTDGPCNGVLRELYEALEALEVDLKAHMHLEDDRLFILAAGLEELCIAQANANS